MCVVLLLFPSFSWARLAVVCVCVVLLLLLCFSRSLLAVMCVVLLLLLCFSWSLVAVVLLLLLLLSLWLLLSLLLRCLAQRLTEGWQCRQVSTFQRFCANAKDHECISYSWCLQCQCLREGSRIFPVAVHSRHHVHAMSLSPEANGSVFGHIVEEDVTKAHIQSEAAIIAVMRRRFRDRVRQAFWRPSIVNL